MKTIIKLILLSIVIYIISLPFVNLFKTGSITGRMVTTECGIIIDKKQPDALISHKHSGTLKVEKEFVIQYDHGIESVEPTTHDFYTHKIGDRVCYEKRKFQV